MSGKEWYFEGEGEPVFIAGSSSRTFRSFSLLNKRKKRNQRILKLGFGDKRVDFFTPCFSAHLKINELA